MSEDSGARDADDAEAVSGEGDATEVRADDAGAVDGHGADGAAGGNAAGADGGDAASAGNGDAAGVDDGDAAGNGESGDDLETLRQQVEEKYDFDDFGPSDMAEMSAEEWEAAFDADTWITGEELLDRVEADLKNRVAERDVFARVERFEDRLIAYSDTGYATVYADGSVEGRGTVLRDVKPTVALASMESYDVPENPPEDTLPEPAAVPEGSGDLGNRMLQVVAGIQVLAGIGLLVAWALVSLKVLPVPGGGSLRSLNVWVMLFAGIGFLVIGIFLFSVVANARLSDKFRAEEFRNRLRAVGVEEGDQPDFLPEDMTIEDLATGPSPAAERELAAADGDGGGDEEEDENEDENEHEDDEGDDRPANDDGAQTTGE